VTPDVESSASALTTTETDVVTGLSDQEAARSSSDALFLGMLVANTTIGIAQEVYSHFLNLEALLEAVVERAVKRTMALYDQAQLENGSPLEALERLIAVGWEDSIATEYAFTSAWSSSAPPRSHAPTGPRLPGSATSSSAAATTTPSAPTSRQTGS
jgi:hypothetical protein